MNRSLLNDIIFQLCIVLVCTFLFSCTQRSASSPDSVDTAKLSVDTFSMRAVPDSLQGTGCLYSESKNTYKHHNYILVTSFAYYGDMAWIIINHKPVALRPQNADKLTIEQQRQWKPDGLHVYTNGIYTLKINTTQGKMTSEESAEPIGKMTLTRKDGQTLSINLFGDCGS